MTMNYCHILCKKGKTDFLISPNPTDLNTYTLPMLLLLLLAVSSLRAQDIHYSQFYNAPLNINPALTGIFGGDIRIMGNYKGQWNTVPVKYRTFTAVVDGKFIRRTAKKGFFSGGLAFNYNREGDSRLSLLNLGLNGSYTHRMSQRSFITLGGRIGANQRRFQLDDLVFDEQFDPTTGQADPLLSSGEDFSSTNNFFLDMGLGLNLRFQGLDAAALVDRLEKRSKLDIGIGIFHLNRPDQSFYDDYKSKLSIRFSPYAMGVLQLGRCFDFILNASVQYQKPYTEYLGMGGLRVHLDRRLGRQLALQLGAGYRFGDFGDFRGSRDGWMPSIELFYKQWQAGFSYDINTSDFDRATQRRGGPEFSLRYIIRKVRPLPYFKHCPII